MRRLAGRRLVVQRDAQLRRIADYFKICRLRCGY
jgi:hypothetical protein